MIYDSEGSVDILSSIQEVAIWYHWMWSPFFLQKKNMEHSRTDFVRKIIAMYNVHTQQLGYSPLYLSSISQIYSDSI